MHTPSTTKRPRRGFTLIELLVVIAIIVTLASIGFSVGASALNKARMLADKNTATSLAIGIEQYYSDYGYYPEVGSGSGATDTVTASNADLMNILLAFNPAGKAKNPRGAIYFAGKPAKGSTAANAHGGLFYSGSTSVELFDVWKKRAPAERHYQVAMDTNHDGRLVDPVDAGSIIHRMPVLVWSTGKDGAYVSTGAKAPENRDNSYSW